MSLGDRETGLRICFFAHLMSRENRKRKLSIKNIQCCWTPLNEIFTAVKICALVHLKKKRIKSVRFQRPICGRWIVQMLWKVLFGVSGVQWCSLADRMTPWEPIAFHRVIRVGSKTALYENFSTYDYCRIEMCAFCIYLSRRANFFFPTCRNWLLHVVDERKMGNIGGSMILWLLCYYYIFIIIDWSHPLSSLTPPSQR
jgi:hypothetical protein